MNKDIFANKIVQSRKKRGYTQQQLANILGVTNKAISRWETGEGFPDITLLKPLCDALGISCDELLSEHKNYTDIEQSDIQKYIPYGVMIVALLIFYILLKLNVPFPLSFFILVAGLWASIYLMLHHTDQEKVPDLMRFATVLLYFPLVSLLQKMVSVLNIKQSWYIE